MTGHRIIKDRTVETDVVILLIAVFHELASKSLQELWVGFGKSKHYKDIPIHSISSQLGVKKCMALLLFHAITGCDYMSFFNTVGKLKFWNTWSLMLSLTDTLIYMAA